MPTGRRSRVGVDVGCGVVDCRGERRDLTGRDKAFTRAVQDEVIESFLWFGRVRAGEVAAVGCEDGESFAQVKQSWWRWRLSHKRWRVLSPQSCLKRSAQDIMPGHTLKGIGRGGGRSSEVLTSATFGTRRLLAVAPKSESVAFGTLVQGHLHHARRTRREESLRFACRNLQTAWDPAFRCLCTLALLPSWQQHTLIAAVAVCGDCRL